MKDASILIVMANPIWSNSLQESLADEGYICATTNSIRGAKEILNITPFKVIILDINFDPSSPILDGQGYALLDWISENGINAKVIIYTGARQQAVEAWRRYRNIANVFGKSETSMDEMICEIQKIVNAV